MNKTQLFDKIAANTGLKKVSVAKVMNTAFEVLEETLKTGDNVTISGFGSFRVVERAARNGKNPQTGKTIKIPAKKVVRFRPGKTLRF